jgi:hypothetical protein
MGTILLYCDFRSAVTFARATSKSLRQRFLEEESASSRATPFQQHVWRILFERHGFSPVEEADEQAADFITTCRRRRKLLRNLVGVASAVQQQPNNSNNSSKNPRKNCFHLPNRYFSFLPIVPSKLLEDEDGMMEDDDYTTTMRLLEDAPPVFCECDSFVLTSSGTSPELVLLDPFDGSLRVVSTTTTTTANTITVAAASDEEAMLMLEQTQAMMVDAATNKAMKAPLGPPPTTPRTRITTQCLLDADEPFELDLDQYFPDRRPAHYATTTLEHQEQFELSHAGMESKPILSSSSSTRGGAPPAGAGQGEMRIEGTMVGVGRSVRHLEDERVVCTELTAWTRKTEESQYGNRKLCRFPWTFHLVDMDACHDRLYVSFPEGDGPGRSDRSNCCTQNQLYVYPLVPVWDDDHETTTTTATTGESEPLLIPKNYYFPDPLCFIQCQHNISCFAVDATGETAIVATIGGTLEVWNVESIPARRHQVLNLQSSLRSSILQKEVLTRRRRTKETEERSRTRTDARQTPSSASSFGKRSSLHSHYIIRDDVTSTSSSASLTPIHNHNHNQNNTYNDDDDSSRVAVLRRQPDLVIFQSPVQSFHLPKHLPLEKSGFVTLQHSCDEGSSLLLWKHCQANSKDDDANKNGAAYQVVSLINLRLSSRRRPRVYYDGSRLIVFGEDPVGAMILVYQMAGTEVPDFEEDDEDDDGDGEASSVGGGGVVYNLTSPPQVRLANRIRHVALGGMDSFDSMHMTCNERFLIVNTNTGNLLGSSPYAEGLLVIDLQDDNDVKTY